MLLKKYKSLLLPLAIILGIIFYKQLHIFINLVPFFICVILFFAYSALHFRRLRFKKINLILLVVHLVSAIVIYALCYVAFKPLVSQSILVGLICPVASASSAVVGVLGGDREVSIVHTLCDNAMVSIVAPIMFSLAETSSDVTFWQSVVTLLAKVFPIMMLPMIALIIMRRFFPRQAFKLSKYEWLSILLWSISLMINFSATTFAVIHMGHQYLNDIVFITIASFVMCVLQFYVGKKIGKPFNQSIASGQALGQRNTGLGIWMAYTYFSNPLTTIYCAGYSLWQNMFNSLQMYLYDTKKQKTTL
ncbi:MAG: hypothetical protein Q4Q06_05305 [Bacteroidota bacterium]|nr:hypothetical protein [Bacteroidota bacterium]